MLTIANKGGWESENEKIGRGITKLSNLDFGYPNPNPSSPPPALLANVTFYSGRVRRPSAQILKALAMLFSFLHMPSASLRHAVR